MIAAAQWRLAGDSAGPADAVNLCLGHDPALAGLYRGVTAFSDALDAPILSVEPTPRVYGPCEGKVLRLEATGGLATLSTHYLNRSADAATESLLRDTRLLVVHSLFRGHAGFAMRWATERRKHYWAVPHGCLDPWGMSRRAIRKHAWMACTGTRFLERAQWLIFATQREQAKALSRVGIARSVVVPFPVILPDLTQREKARAELRGALGLSANDRLLLYAGRLTAMKRPRELLAAFAHAQAKHLALLVVGGDDDLSREQLTRSLPRSTAGRVFFVGYLQGAELQRTWLGVDGFISLSHRENFCFSLAEACAYGLPIIATPGHDLVHEMPFQGDRCAVGWLLTDLFDATAAEAISEFAKADDSRLRAYGAAARGWASEILDPSRFRDRLRTLVT